MRVLINTIPLYGKTPGLRTYTANLLRALHASDADMEWRVLLHPADMERLGLAGDPRFRPIGLSSLSGLSRVSGVRFVWRNATEQLSLAAIGAHCDLMHYLDSYGPFFIPATVPVALTVHDLIPLGREQYFARWAQAYLAVLMRRTIPRAWELLAISAHTAQQLTALLGIPPERIAVVPNGVDARFRPQSTEEVRRVSRRYGLPDRYAISVGSIHPRKNVARLVRAFARARLDYALPHHLLLVGGLGWGYDDVLAAMREANAAGAADIVRSLGHVPEGDLAPLIAGAECLAYPSLDEGFGLPVVEAMACGTPVLTSAGSALVEVAGGAALLVDPRDEGSIAGGLARVLGDDVLRSTLREDGLARAARLSWEAVADGVLGAYHRVAESRVGANGASDRAHAREDVGSRPGS